jgi:hypothetical protein
MPSILDVVLICPQCRGLCRVMDAIPCANGGTGYGCPRPDCGGLPMQPTPEGTTIYGDQR